MLRQASVPGVVVRVAAKLQRAGHAAVLVGGAVRDVLLRRPASDWDLASSATPDEVMALFSRTVPTGVAHGTVTVLVRDAEQTHPVEITTFRGEGVYVDGRRPQSVRFLRDLEQDLARRDFTVNAFAWDPVAERFSDPFGGLADLAAGLVRAVGEPAERFGEDGLRAMRAVRFCATRQLTLEPRTAAAIPGALDVLDKVSGERVHVELHKLLSSAEPSRGLRPMWTTGIWPRVLPALPDAAAYEAAIVAVDAMAPEPVARLARLMWPVAAQADGRATINACIESLKTSRQQRATVLALTGKATTALASATTPESIRRAAAALGRGYVDGALSVLGADRDRRLDVGAAIEGAALTTAELAIKGRDLIAEGIVAAGPQLGRRLAGLLDAVLVDPGLNTREQLLALAAVPPG